MQSPEGLEDTPFKWKIFLCDSQNVWTLISKYAVANTSKTSSIKSPSITVFPPHIFKPSYGPIKYREKAQMLSSFLKCCDVQKHYRVVSKTGAIEKGT